MSVPNPATASLAGDFPDVPARFWALKIVPPTLLSVAVWIAADVGYLLGHMAAEVFSVIIAMTAMVVSTTSRHFTRNHFAVFVAVAIGWSGVLDLAHMFAYKGMNLIPTTSANPATQLWIGARLIQALAMLAAPFMLTRKVASATRLHLVFGLAALMVVLAVATGWFPDAYIDGQGLTPFKIYAEYFAIVLMAMSLVLLWQRRKLLSQPLLLGMTAALLAMMAAEFVLTLYVNIYSHANLAGHLLKIYAFWFVYVALVRSTMAMPFAMLARAASTYDAIPEPTFIVGADGVIQRANAFAARQLGQPPAWFVGRGAHDLLHDPRVKTSECPLCRQLGQRDGDLETLLALPGDEFAECHLAPFSLNRDPLPAWVMVVRNVTERERLKRDRERLVADLAERVKELRCLSEVSLLSSQADLTMAQLLERVQPAVAQGFRSSQWVAVGIDSTWGRFGPAVPRNPVALLEAEILDEGVSAGWIRAWYADVGRNAGGSFLPEEDVLLRTVASRIAEASLRHRAQERVRRLTFLYELLGEANRAISRSVDRPQLEAALYQALQAQGAFPKIFIAISDSEGPPWQVAYHHGFAPEHLPLLEATLSHPDSRLTPLAAHLRSGRVGVLTLHDQPVTAGTFFADWEDYLSREGVHHRAFMPLMCERRLVGLVGVYAAGSVAFDEEQVRLLEDLSADVSFALDRFVAEDRQQAAEAAAQEVEQRFRELFRMSPVPMQISGATDKRVEAINEAHQQWLGYTLEDFPDEDAWFNKIYPDETARREARAHWTQGVVRARAGEVVTSPEFRLRCKNGSTRIAQGRLSVINDTAVIAWIDLTDVYRHEQALRESEQRFRGMVEQSITGMYVRRDGRFLYVNPRFCDIVGWSAEELLGREVLGFVDPDLANHQRVHDAWQHVGGGDGQSVSYTVTMRRKDGQTIDLGLSGRSITWDDGLPATIMMSQDITEKKRAQDRIAAYVKQLEATMRGTLNAVASMVEMRDPYTAGHEHRVGLIAAAIGREMGWDEERCTNLEMLGLVHDVGKIAVPAEILVKPSRLSPVEMELVRGHAEAGYQILRNVPFPTPVAEIVRQHHERMDGSGYPQGLKGDQILPEARVLAVADVLESMASHRPYRPALGIDVALAEIIRGRGPAYDPEVCDALLRLVHDKGYQLPT